MCCDRCPKKPHLLQVWLHRKCAKQCVGVSAPFHARGFARNTLGSCCICPRQKCRKHQGSPPRLTYMELYLYCEWERGLEWIVSKNNEVLREFFSSSQSLEQYPCPLTDEFWKTYQEPTWAWMRAATVLCESMKLVSDYATQRYEGKSVEDRHLHRVNDALWVLNLLADSEGNWYEFGPSALKLRSGSTSLLSVMAKMFFSDISTRRRLLGCGTCMRKFVSRDPRARYCTPRCRNTAQVSRTRDKLALQQKSALWSQSTE